MGGSIIVTLVKYDTKQANAGKHFFRRERGGLGIYGIEGRNVEARCADSESIGRIFHGDSKGKGFVGKSQELFCINRINCFDYVSLARVCQ